MSSKNDFESKKESPTQFPPEEAKEVIANLPQILTDPIEARKLTQRLLALGKVEDPASKERLRDVGSKLIDCFEGSTQTHSMRNTQRIISAMIEALSLSKPYAIYSFMQIADCQEIGPFQGCLDDCLQLMWNHHQIGINTKDRSGETLLQNAASNGKLEMVKFLTEKYGAEHSPMAENRSNTAAFKFAGEQPASRGKSDAPDKTPSKDDPASFQSGPSHQ